MKKLEEGMDSKRVLEVKNDEKITLFTLWRQFLPLSMSDITMFFGDPLMNATLAHLPEARLNLASVGVAKAQAIFFESPIIMMLHASNVLANSERARRALWKFMILSIIFLASFLLLLTFPPIFKFVGKIFFGIEGSVLRKSGVVLMILFLWPAAIGWRRYYQGLLIRFGHNKEVGLASMGRLIFTGISLLLGFLLKIPGHILAGLTLIGGVIFEAIFVSLAAKKYHLFYRYPLFENIDSEGNGMMGKLTDKKEKLPKNLKEVWKFYWPLANSMLVVWGGRALLIGVLARAVDSTLALAAWPVAWSLVILVANATRMVQQIIIRHRHQVSDGFLLYFTFSVGVVFSLILLMLGETPLGREIVAGFVGNDQLLLESILQVIFMAMVLPLLVAIQNAFQGFLIGDGKTSQINLATWISTLVLLGGTTMGVSFGWAGVKSASASVTLGLFVELIVLSFGIKWRSQVLLKNYF